MRSKYVVGMVHCDNKFEFKLGAVVFPEFVAHSEMARRMFCDVESAGFVDVLVDADLPFGVGVRCFGRSESLNMESNPERDEQLVRQALGLTY